MLEKYANKSNIIQRVSHGTAQGRQIDMNFEEKYGFSIEEKHLDRIKTDLNKIYKEESADLMLEELLIEHKQKLKSNTNYTSLSQFLADSAHNKYTFFIAISQNVLTRFTGANFFQFYCVFSFGNLGIHGNWA